MYRLVRSELKGLRLLLLATRQWLFEMRFGSLFSAKPRTLQFPVNDICNSRCVMCNIWQRKRDHEITPVELGQILRDPLFSDVQYVGISGGEPTLRDDLPDIGRQLIRALPHLRGLGVITNALRAPMVTERIEALAEVAYSAKLAFSVSISLDGIEETHDRNRGVQGNFSSAMRVIHALQQHGCHVAVGCTLTPLNCYGADDVLLWCGQNGIYDWEFRLGVDIKRVYNEGYAQQHPFTPEQLFHLIMFFDKLSRDPRVGELHQDFYASLVGQLAFGLPRSAGCDWQSSRGVTLDTRGNISYCSVQSPILDSALEKSAWQIFRDNQPVRQRIVQKYCANCQHDLLGPPSSRILARQSLKSMTAPWLKISRKLHERLTIDRFKAPRSIAPTMYNRPAQWNHVLITGWYGTETAGDKAILGELLHFLRTYAPACKITLTTLDHKVSRQTAREIAGLENVQLIDMARGSRPALIETVDAVIIGGGPLEEIGQMEYIWRMFMEANRQHKARILFGCGVGPLHSERLHQMVSTICYLTTAGFVRDEESRQYAIKLGATVPLGRACDPALAYIRRWAGGQAEATSPAGQPCLISLVRANTSEYTPEMTDAERESHNKRSAQRIAQALNEVHIANGAKINLLPMHSIWMGGDDRIFNRQISVALGSPETFYVERRYLPLSELLNAIRAGDVAMVMRYHGHLFCMALGIPFLSVDYTGYQGKVYNLVNRIGYSKWSENWLEMEPKGIANRLNELIEERKHWSCYLLQQTDRLIAELHQTYNQVFQVG